MSDGEVKLGALGIRKDVIKVFNRRSSGAEKWKHARFKLKVIREFGGGLDALKRRRSSKMTEAPALKENKEESEEESEEEEEKTPKRQRTAPPPAEARYEQGKVWRVAFKLIRREHDGCMRDRYP